MKRETEKILNSITEIMEEMKESRTLKREGTESKKEAEKDILRNLEDEQLEMLFE